MIISRTPFRISFFGGGTDYPVWYEKHGGATLSTTIDKYSYITARYYPPFFPAKHRIVYSKIETVNDRNDIDHPSVREVLKFLNIEQGMEIHNSADLPARSGLGSSSAFTVGLLNAIYQILDQPATKKKLALDAIHVEQDLIKENVGSQDQTAVSFGGFNKITFGIDRTIDVHPIILPPGRIESLNERLMLFFTGFSRNASEVAAEWIKSAPNKEQELRMMYEMVDVAVDILHNQNKNMDEFGRLLHESWQIKRGLNDAITTDSIDEIYTSALRAGALGGKLLGAGHGGFMLIYADPEAQPRILEALRGLIHVPFKFEISGSQIIQNGLTL